MNAGRPEQMILKYLSRKVTAATLCPVEKPRPLPTVNSIPLDGTDSRVRFPRTA